MEELEETARLARAANGSVCVSAHRVDVSDRARVEAFAGEVLAAHGGQVHVLFANAGLTVPGSLLHDASMSATEVAAYEARWDRCFAVDYFGVLHCVRAFLPHIVKQEEGYIVNTASVNGFWTWPDHGAYTSAKFAVRGLTDSLLIECSVKAPHVKVASVMPGGVRTGIVRNSGYTGCGVVDKLFTGDGGLADLTADEAAAWILDGVAAGKTRILVGYDALLLDFMSRFGGPHRSYAMYAALAREGVTNFDLSKLALTEKQIKNVSLLGWLRVALNGGAHFALFMWPFALLRHRRHPLAKAAGIVLAASLLRKIVKRLAAK
jgi:NAD(P)-dependent dehydrogenase (short-subunit alcohol dehydrogenase family)